MAAKKTGLTVTFIILGAVLLVLATYFVASYYFSNQASIQKEKDISFVRDYSVAINHIYVGMQRGYLSVDNLNTGNNYVSGDSSGVVTYYYAIAEPFYTTSKDQAIEAKEYFSKAKIKLETIKDSSPNDFFRDEINNRLEQISYLIIWTDLIYNQSDYAQKELYEINYGSAVKANEYWVKYNALIPEGNSNQKNLGDITAKIDSAWDQEWYPAYQAPITGGVIASPF